MPSLTRRTLLLAKTETEIGTWTEPSATTDALIVSNLAVRVLEETIERDDYTDTLSPRGSTVGLYYGEMTFDTYARGLGDVPTAIAPLREDPLFQCCGLVPDYGTGTSCIYELTSDFFTTPRSASMAAFKDGLEIRVKGAFGSVRFTGRRGQPGRYSWTIRGAMANIPLTPTADDAIIDAAFPSPITYQLPTVDPLPLIGVTLSVHTVGTMCIADFNWDLANALNMRDCMTAASGLESFFVGGRKPTLTINPEQVNRATLDFFGKWRNASVGEISLAWGSATDDTRITHTFPYTKFRVPTFGDRNTLAILDVPVDVIGSAGDDELTIMYD